MTKLNLSLCKSIAHKNTVEALVKRTPSAREIGVRYWSWPLTRVSVKRALTVLTSLGWAMCRLEDGFQSLEFIRCTVYFIISFSKAVSIIRVKIF